MMPDSHQGGSGTVPSPPVDALSESAAWSGDERSHETSAERRGRGRKGALRQWLAAGGYSGTLRAGEPGACAGNRRGAEGDRRPYLNYQKPSYIIRTLSHDVKRNRLLFYCKYANSILPARNTLCTLPSHLLSSALLIPLPLRNTLVSICVPSYHSLSLFASCLKWRLYQEA